jgi:hypothetical protein
VQVSRILPKSLSSQNDSIRNKTSFGKRKPDRNRHESGTGERISTSFERKIENGRFTSANAAFFAFLPLKQWKILRKQS